MRSLCDIVGHKWIIYARKRVGHFEGYKLFPTALCNTSQHLRVCFDEKATLPVYHYTNKCAVCNKLSCAF